MKWEKYFKRRGRILPLQNPPSELYRIKQLVVIPARGEKDSLPRCLSSLAANSPEACKDTWCLVVVNNPPPGHAGSEYAGNNQQTIDWLRRTGTKFPFALSFIDAATPGCEQPAEFGVGLARKTGADTAIQQLLLQANNTSDNNQKTGKKLIFHLDADTLVATDYLKTSRFAMTSAKADFGIVNFEHQPANQPVLQTAIDNYELFMRCYVHGLEWAGSPYAFHTIGSTMVSTIEAYLRADGIPARRQAGEDFYFLQQLAKTGRHCKITRTTVYPAARPSNRVPFGTGPHLLRMLAANNSERENRLDPPAAFATLKKLLQTVENNLEDDALTILQKLRKNSESAHDFLIQKKFSKVWPAFQLRCGQNRPALAKAFNQWFDGLSTRQFIHAVTHRRLSFDEAWPQWTELSGIPPCNCVREGLDWLRNRQLQDSTSGR